MSTLEDAVKSRWLHNAKFKVLCALGVRMKRKDAVSFYLSGSRYNVVFYNNKFCRILKD